MAISEFIKIDCEWLESENEDKDPSKACRGSIAIRVGEQCLTKMIDFFGNTLRDRIHVSAYPLAMWFAANWWRLRWEPETYYADWLMAHSMASAGEGYSWPEILFKSDGETLTITSRATQEQPTGPVRYLNNVHTHITAKTFEDGVDTFLDLVLARLKDRGHSSSQLAELWSEVQKERLDPKLAQWRRMEALYGFDPDEAPKPLIEMLIEKENNQ